RARGHRRSPRCGGGARCTPPRRRVRRRRAARSVPRAWRAAGGRPKRPAQQRRPGSGGRASSSRSWRSSRRSLWQPAEAALSPAEFADRRGEIGGADIRPVAVAEVELGVRALPQQEVAEALLAAGADEEVDVGEEEARLDRGTAGVVGEGPEEERLVAGGRLLGRVDRHAEEGGEPVAAADDLEPHAVRDEPRSLAPQVAGEEAHQGRDLVGGRFQLSAENANSVSW